MATVSETANPSKESAKQPNRTDRTDRTDRNKDKTEDTDERILLAFLRLVAERGFEGTATRALAEAAGVNEVTIFRHFGDKTGLVRAAYKRFGPEQRLSNYPIAIDTTTPSRAAQGIVRCLCYMRDRMLEHPELLQFGMSDARRFPDLNDEVAKTARTGRAILEEVFRQAAPVLHPDVDTAVTAFQMLSMLLISVIWSSRGWLPVTPEQWDAMFDAAIRPLLRDA